MLTSADLTLVPAPSLNSNLGTTSARVTDLFQFYLIRPHVQARRTARAAYFLHQCQDSENRLHVKEWFENHDIRTTDWPPYSPDLNPIENAWHALKVLALKMFPDVMNGKGDTEEARKNIEECLQAAWKALSNDLFESLIESMPRRVAACIAAEGWHTKY
jgi:hypothetical protein